MPFDDGLFLLVLDSTPLPLAARHRHDPALRATPLCRLLPVPIPGMLQFPNQWGLSLSYGLSPLLVLSMPGKPGREVVPALFPARLQRASIRLNVFTRAVLDSTEHRSPRPNSIPSYAAAFAGLRFQWLSRPWTGAATFFCSCLHPLEALSLAAQLQTNAIRNRQPISAARRCGMRFFRHTSQVSWDSSLPMYPGFRRSLPSFHSWASHLDLDRLVISKRPPSTTYHVLSLSLLSPHSHRLTAIY